MTRRSLAPPAAAQPPMAPGMQLLQLLLLAAASLLLSAQGTQAQDYTGPDPKALECKFQFSTNPAVRPVQYLNIDFRAMIQMLPTRDGFAVYSLRGTVTFPDRKKESLSLLPSCESQRGPGDGWRWCRQGGAPGAI